MKQSPNFKQRRKKELGTEQRDTGASEAIKMWSCIILIFSPAHSLSLLLYFISPSPLTGFAELRTTPYCRIWPPRDWKFGGLEQPHGTASGTLCGPRWNSRVGKRDIALSFLYLERGDTGPYKSLAVWVGNIRIRGCARFHILHPYFWLKRYISAISGKVIIIEEKGVIAANPGEVLKCATVMTFPTTLWLR